MSTQAGTQRNPEMFDIAFPNSTPSDNTGRCEALTLPQYDGDLPAYRCVRVGSVLIDRRLVCPAHARLAAAIRYCDQPNN
jgi:hypothetical protein